MQFAYFIFVALNFPSMIEQAAQQQRRNAAEIFLSEWGTMGRNRPTLRTLLNLLVAAELFRAADYVAGDILKGTKDKMFV